MRASGYLVQWEESKRGGWHKARVYYSSKPEAVASAETLKAGRCTVRKLEVHALYKR